MTELQSGDDADATKVGEAAIADPPSTGDGDEQRISIRSCPCCDGSHSQIVFHAYARQQGTWTHYYHCPATGDPVPIAVKLIDGRVRRIDQNVMQALADVLDRGWMVAVFHAVDGVVHVTRVTRDFFPGDFDAAIVALSKNLSEEAGRQVGVQSPLRIGPGDPGLGVKMPLQMPVGQARVRRVEDLR